MNRVKRRGTLSSLPFWLAVTMMNTSVLLGLLIWRRASNGSDLQPSSAHLLVILWAAITLFMFTGSARGRCQRLELVLPISARTLFRRHLARIFVAGTLLFAGSLVVLALHATLLGRSAVGSAIEIPYPSLAASVLSGLFLAIVIIERIEPGLWRLGGNRTHWIFLSLSLLGVLALLLLLHPWPWLSTSLCLVLAIILVTRHLRSLPAAYHLVPHTAALQDLDVSVSATTSHTASRGHVIRLLFRVLYACPPWKQFTPWVLFAFVALMGFILAGGLNRWADTDHLRLLYISFGSYMLFASVGVLIYHLYRLDPLPIPRPQLFALLILPGLIVHCGAWAAGRLAVLTDPTPSLLVDFKVLDIYPRQEGQPDLVGGSQEPRTMVWVDVAPRFMRVALNGEAPILTAPWGESHRAWSQPLLRGLPTVVYSPYNTVEEATADFEALMATRAIEDIHGRSIPLEEIRERYFRVENDRVVGLRPGGFSLLADYPDLERPPSPPETPVFMAIILVPWLLLTALLARSLRATHSTKYIRGIYLLGLGILLAVMFVQAVLEILGQFDSQAGIGLLASLIESLGAGAFSVVATWLVSLTLVLVSYRLALTQFERAEIPGIPINCSLIDLSKSD